MCHHSFVSLAHRIRQRGCGRQELLHQNRFAKFCPSTSLQGSHSPTVGGGQDGQETRWVTCGHWLPGCGRLGFQHHSFVKGRSKNHVRASWLKNRCNPKFSCKQKPISNNSISKHHLKLKRRFRSLACLCHVMGAKNKENWAA